MLWYRIPPVVMLHLVTDDKIHDDLKPYTISRESFTRLLDYLQEHQFETLLTRDVSQKHRWGSKTVILTFDDCPKHLWDFAIPELIKRNMKAVFFMPTSYIGGYNEWNVLEGRSRADLMDETDLRRLVEAGMEVGSHSHHHIELEYASEDAVVFEMAESKRILEQITGQEIISIAYPYGSVPSSYNRILKDTGYQFGFGIYLFKQSRYALRRFIYHDGDNKSQIHLKLSPLYNFGRIWMDKYLIFRTTFKRYLGGITRGVLRRFYINGNVFILPAIDNEIFGDYIFFNQFTELIVF